MSGLKQPILDVITKLTPIFPTVRIWNSQVRAIIDGKGYDFLMPAAFVEVAAPVYLPLGAGFSQADLTLTIHIVHECYDAGDGTMDQDLAVFGLRDQVITLLAAFQPTACSSMMLVGETLDFDHDDIYEYKLEFKTAFIDSKGSPYDPNSTVYQQSVPPLAEITTVTQGVAPSVQDTSYYTINP